MSCWTAERSAPASRRSPAYELQRREQAASRAAAAHEEEVTRLLGGPRTAQDRGGNQGGAVRGRRRPGCPFRCRPPAGDGSGVADGEGARPSPGRAGNRTGGGLGQRPYERTVWRNASVPPKQLSTLSDSATTRALDSYRSNSRSSSLRTVPPVDPPVAPRRRRHRRRHPHEAL